MSKRSAPLSAKKLQRLRPDPHRTLELVDGAVPGLRFRLSPSGEKSWSLSARIGGIRRRVALGKNLGLADARRQAEHARSAIAKGEDPAEARKAVFARRKDATRGMGTFGSVISAYYEQGPGESLRSGLASRALIERVFRDHLLRPALDLRTTELQLAIDAWRSKSSGRHCAAYFRPIARWACKRGLMLKGEALEAPTLAKPNQRVLTRVQLGKLLPELEARGHGAAARFMLLSGARREEVCAATWREIKDGVWSIPGTRRKDTRRNASRALEDHVLPLSRQAVALIERLGPCEPDMLLFSGERGARLTNWPRWSARMRRQVGLDVSPHTLRRTCATLAGDLGYPPHVVSALLGHRSIGGTLHSGYNQSRYRSEVAVALQAVADILDAIGGAESTVFATPQRA
jgi:integrase